MSPNSRKLDPVISELRKHASSIDSSSSESDIESSFFVADLGEILRQHERWVKRLPRVTPCYAVKCNSEPTVLRFLAKLGCNFDCASKGEVKLVLRETEIKPERIVYAHPCKPPSAIRYAAEKGVKQTMFDSVDELRKVKKNAPDSELYLRIVADDSGSTCKFSEKFGTTDHMSLLREAKQLALNVVGVSFHVGSGASDPTAFRKSIYDARSVFDAASSLGFDFHTLDLGGGLTSENFEQAANVINPLIDEMFPSTRIIAEPGRYYVTEAFTLACNVIARREVQRNIIKLFINDGIYTNFLAFKIDQLPDPEPKVLLSANMEAKSAVSPSTNNDKVEEIMEYSVWGQTADGVDQVVRTWRSAALVEIGDWLYFECMGAYTIPSQTRFNGFPDHSEILYVSTEVPGPLAT